MYQEITNKKLDYQTFTRILAQKKQKQISPLILIQIKKKYEDLEKNLKNYRKSTQFFNTLKNCDCHIPNYLYSKNLKSSKKPLPKKDFELTLYDFNFNPLLEDHLANFSSNTFPFIRNILSEMRPNQKKRIYIHSALLGNQKGLICDIILYNKNVPKNNAPFEVTKPKELKLRKQLIKNLYSILYAKYLINYFASLKPDLKLILKNLNSFKSNTKNLASFEEIYTLHLKIYQSKMDL